MIETQYVIQTTTIISGIFAIFSSLELLGVRNMYKNHGIMSWKVVLLATGNRSRPTFITNPIKKFSFLLIGRLLAGAILIGFAITNWISPIILTILLLMDILIRLRHVGGLNGAFDMALVTNGGLLIATIFSGYSVVKMTAILFIATQGILSYFIAGVAKAISEQWRSGQALEMVFSTKTWGDIRVYKILQNYPKTKFVGSWVVIVFECFFPIVLFVKPQFALFLFVIAFMFHIANGVFMGINSFVFIFPSTYPAIYYANQLFHSL